MATIYDEEYWTERRKRNAERRAKRTEEGTVYYLESFGLVKIGHTINLEARLVGYRTHNPAFRLIATEPGTRETERARHAQFADSHETLEWYRKSMHLEDFIAGLKTRAG